jgi:hypothetical protein
MFFRIQNKDRVQAKRWGSISSRRHITARLHIPIGHDEFNMIHKTTAANPNLGNVMMQGNFREHL